MHYAVLTLFMVVATLLYWGHSIYFFHDAPLIPLSDTVYTFCNLAVYPMFLCYIISLTTNGKKIISAFVRWLLPSFICTVLVGVTYAGMSDEELSEFTDSYLYMASLDNFQGMPFVMAKLHILRRLVFIVQMPFVVVSGLRHIRRFNKLVDSLYADTEHKSLYSIHVVLYLFLAISLLSIVCNILGRKVLVTSTWILTVPSIMFSALLYGFGYIGHLQAFSFADIQNDIEGTGEQESVADMKDVEADDNILNIDHKDVNVETNTGSRPSELRQRIERVMKDDKLFLTPNLKLVDLVKKLGTNRSYIYNAINREMGTSFSEYVNSLRVEYACEVLQHDPSIPIQKLSVQSGFSSDVSFYRNFKLFKGGSPKDYIKTRGSL
ncbi:MAG: AraC family transcriptional regulator [Bacteroidaceae bacterium]|nr:AraC family transcriptional regulator [Bacteroidaceae bacterium]